MMQMTKTAQTLLAITLFLLTNTQVAMACSPAPGAMPASLADRVANAEYVFEGTVFAQTKSIPSLMMINVSHQFKGDIGESITLGNFNQTSCDDFISSGDSRIFFVNKNDRGTYVPVYDGAFGSTKPLNADNVLTLNNIINGLPTVTPDLNISIPKALYYESEENVRDIWVDFEFNGVNSQGEYTWKLKEFGDNN